MLNANRLPPFQWRKKKGQLIPTSFFLKSTPEATTLETKSVVQVEENKATYTTTAEEEKKAATQEIQAPKEVVVIMDGTKITAAGISALKAALPDATVEQP